jgi:hypothetical protein
VLVCFRLTGQLLLQVLEELVAVLVHAHERSGFGITCARLTMRSSSVSMFEHTNVLCERAESVSRAASGSGAWSNVPPFGGDNPIEVSQLEPMRATSIKHLQAYSAQVAQCPHKRRHGCVVCPRVVRSSDVERD